ncbi:MAG: DNA alkylation repair protein [Holosporaceae bacterium]|jgi:3-methyladenine DNA glycosylase AlkD|nr:DNA alkylation repair protein [Holosporaceae bacterium]
MTVTQIIDEIKNISSEKYAAFVRKMIQSETGYGKGDVVLGCKTPDLRKIAKKYQDAISMDDLLKLLQSQYHEVRILSLIIMRHKFQNENLQKNIVKMYLDNAGFINNWDLVDISARHIVGSYFSHDDDIFEQLSNSPDLWENRIAVVATHAFIGQNYFDLTLRLCKKFMTHKHHLIHKACGWMLREIGKKNENVLADFLRENHSHMPRIMLSYAKERLHPQKVEFLRHDLRRYISDVP